MQLNENYRIVYDSDNTILQFFEQREIKVQKVGTGEFKEATENFYYPNLKTALLGFLIKCTWGLDTSKEVLSKLNELEGLIKTIK